MSVEFVDEQGGKAAIADVRSDSTPTDWVLFSYENAKSQKIVLVGSGSGGVSELLSNLSDDIVGYGLVRKSDKIDDSVTVKFAFIMWLGDNVPRMQKARISIHQGKMKEWIGQYHVDINASHKDELSDQILMEKIMDFSGSGSRVLDKTTGAKQLSSQASASATSGNKPSQTTNKAKQGLEWSDQAALKDAIQQVRNDNDPTTWVLFTYDGDDSNNIVLLDKGNGNVNDEVVPHLKDNAVVYGLVRKIEQVDDSQTVKFAFFRFVGDNINRMLRARLGTHFGAVTAFFHPYHVTIDATSASEVSDETIVKTIKIAAGTAVHVQDVVRPTPTVTSNTTSSSNAPTKTSATGVRNPVIPKSVPTSDNQAVKYKDEQDTKDLIRDVRSDSTSTNWCLVGYEGGKGNVLVSLGKGDGGVEELKSHLQDNIVAYGLVRKTEKIDDSVTVKFAFIYWTGENIDRMHRARIGTHTGAVSSLFTPYHTDLKVTQLNELSDEIIQTRIGEASGTKSHVKS